MCKDLLRVPFAPDGVSPQVSGLTALGHKTFHMDNLAMWASTEATCAFWDENEFMFARTFRRNTNLFIQNSKNALLLY